MLREVLNVYFCPSSFSEDNSSRTNHMIKFSGGFVSFIFDLYFYNLCLTFFSLNVYFYILLHEFVNMQSLMYSYDLSLIYACWVYQS